MSRSSSPSGTANSVLAALPPKWRAILVLVAIVGVCGCYAALAGGKPPVLRAVLVVSAFGLARTLGRQARLCNVLSLAALTLLLVRAANVDNVGVHLSFLAVGTIGVFVIQQGRPLQRRTALQSLIEESHGIWMRWSRVCLRAIQNMWLLSVWGRLLGIWPPWLLWRLLARLFCRKEPAQAIGEFRSPAAPNDRQAGLLEV